MSYRVVTVHVYASPGSEIEIGYVDTGYASRYLANAQALGMRKLGHDDFLIVQDNGRNGFVAVFDASDLGRHHPEDDGFIAEALGLKWSGPNPPESQAPEPTALDAGGSEGMETAPPAVTIPEDLAKEDDLLYALLVRHHALRIAAAEVLPGPDGQDEIDRERLIEQWVELAHDEAGMVKRPLPSVAVLAQLGDKVGPIVARLAKLDRIEATRRAVKAGPAIPSPSDWEAFIDALDGEP